MNRRKLSPVEFYETAVLPTAFDRLPEVFPDFGFVRKGRGWTAQNRDATKASFGARADRLICNQPGGFWIHGEGRVSWLEYLEGAHPTGADFVSAVRKLAELAGVDASPLDRELTPEQAERLESRVRQGDLLETFLAIAGDRLETDETARRYLESRGLDGDGLGVCPPLEEISKALAGFTESEIEASGLLADRRWSGRLVIPWRGPSGRLESLIARDLTGKADPGEKYLRLKGSRVESPVFGLDMIDGRRDGLVLVEGLLDVFLLRQKGLTTATATGGNFRQLTPDRWRALSDLVPSVVLASDNDPTGYEALEEALENFRKGDQTLKVYVLDPAILGDHKDPDEFVRAKGLEAFQKALSNCYRWSTYLAEKTLSEANRDAEGHPTREALEQVLDLAADLRGPYAALDREDVLRTATTWTQYSREALDKVQKEIQTQRERERTQESARRIARELDASLARGGDVYQLTGKARADLERLEHKTEDFPPPFSVDALVDILKTTPEGLTSGWSSLDEKGVRFQPKELAILGARTGHGKTTVLVHLLRNWLDRDLGGPLVLFTHEEPTELVLCRLAALLTADHSITGDRWPFIAVRDFLRNPEGRELWSNPKTLRDALDRLRGYEDRLHIVHRPGWTAGQIYAESVRIADQKGLGAVFVDYLQRIPPEGKADRRDMEVSAIGRTLKALAIDMAVPVVAAAQINREAIPDKYQKTLQDKLRQSVEAALEEAKTARPDLHNLREGGSEQEADLVLGLMNYAADIQTQDRAINRYEIGVLKNRYGARGSWTEFEFDGRTGRLRDTKDRAAPPPTATPQKGKRKGNLEDVLPGGRP